MVETILKRNLPGIGILALLIVLNGAILVLDRTRFPKAVKIRVNRLLFQSVVFASGAYLLAMIVLAGQWELLPWTFVICYLAFVIIGVRGGLVWTGLSWAVMVIAYVSMPAAEMIPRDNLLFRFLPAFATSVILFAGVEYIRNDYRRRLAAANQTLSESERKYRRLYEKLAENYTIEIEPLTDAGEAAVEAQ